MIERDIFGAGVAPGSPGSAGEIKMLICYVLSVLDEPLSFDRLHEALRENELVNYFELIEALVQLRHSGHIEATGEPGGPEAFAATELGRATARELSPALPLSVRDKATAAAKLSLSRERRLREVHITETPSEGGFIMEFSIPDSNLARFCLFVPTKGECELLRRRFLNDPLFIYKGVVALLTGDKKVLGEIFPQEEKLF